MTYETPDATLYKGNINFFKLRDALKKSGIERDIYLIRKKEQDTNIHDSQLLYLA